METEDSEERSEELQNSRRISWKPTSKAKLAETEEKILRAFVKNHYKRKYVVLPKSQNRIWTITVNGNLHKTKVPIVLVHGMGGGIGLWAQNLDALSQDRTLYAFDLLGFGRSSRPTFSTDPETAEQEFVESIEEWRQAMGIDEMILLGHSLGGFISCSYAISYPQNIKHLILVDPWGFSGKPSEEQLARIPVVFRMIGNIVKHFNPLAVIRAAGPCGPGLVKKFRSDLREKFAHTLDDFTISDYIYHCNAQSPSGEAAFKTMSRILGWAQIPMLDRVTNIHKDLHITMMHGEKSWIDRSIGYQVKYLRKESFVDIAVVTDAGHHLYADKPRPFNKIVTRICAAIDNKSLPKHMSFIELLEMQESPETGRKHEKSESDTQ